MLYGDGLFETIAVVDNHPFCWDQHLSRLLAGCRKLGIPFDDPELLTSEMVALCKGIGRAVLKIIITSGTGSRGYRRPTVIEPTRLLATHPWPDYPDGYWKRGTKIHLCSTRFGHNEQLSGIKHLNRLEQVLARTEWSDTDIIEGIMLDCDDHVISGTMSNLFIIRGNKLLTPELKYCGIAGIVRQFILAHCINFGCESVVSRLSLDDIYTADELFFCNSIMGVLPANQLLEHKFLGRSVTQKVREFLLSRKIIAVL